MAKATDCRSVPPRGLTLEVQILPSAPIMSNQINHRRARNANNRRHNERPVPAMGCNGEGHNGQLGRKDWKLLSRRNERRNNKQGRLGSIRKAIKKTRPYRKNSTMHRGIEISGGGVRRKNFCPKPLPVCANPA